MDMLTASGTYYTRIYKNGLYYLSGVVQTSTNTCSDLDPAEHTNNLVIANLSSFILQNYPQLSQYALTLVQGYMGPNGSLKYRMLYAKNTNRQEAQIVLNLGKYVINKITQYTGNGCDPFSVNFTASGLCSRAC